MTVISVRFQPKVGAKAMQKRIVGIALCASAKAQQPPKVPRIGFLSGSGDIKNPGFNVEAFRQGLRNLGYIEGKNILVDYRYAEGKADRLSVLSLSIKAGA